MLLRKLAPEPEFDASMLEVSEPPREIWELKGIPLELEDWYRVVDCVGLVWKV